MNPAWSFLPEDSITILRQKREHISWRFLLDAGMKPTLRHFGHCARHWIRCKAFWFYKVSDFIAKWLCGNCLLSMDTNTCVLVYGAESSKAMSCTWPAAQWRHFRALSLFVLKNKPLKFDLRHIKRRSKYDTCKWQDKSPEKSEPLLLQTSRQDVLITVAHSSHQAAVDTQVW